MLWSHGPQKNIQPAFIFHKLLCEPFCQKTTARCGGTQVHAYHKAFARAAQKKINLVDAALFKLVKYSTYTEIVKYMGEFSVDPKRVVKMAARLMRVDLIKRFLMMHGKIN